MNFLTSHSVKIQIVLDTVEADLSDGEAWETIITKSTTSTVFVVIIRTAKKKNRRELKWQPDLFLIIRI